MERNVEGSVMTCRQGLHMVAEWRTPAFPVKSDHSRRSSMLWTTRVIAVLISLGAVAVDAHAQAQTVTGANLQKAANGVLMLMGYSLMPDVTTGSLSIANAETGSRVFRCPL